MFIELTTFQGKLTLALSFLFISILGTLTCRTILPNTLSEALRIKVFIFFQEFIVLSVYIFKYSQVGFEFAETHYYWQEYGIIVCAMGYLAHIILASYFRLIGRSELIHHCVTIGMMYVCIAGDYVQLGNLTNFMFELSHPGYLFRLLFKELNRRCTLIYELVETYYFLSYIFLRPIGGLYLIYRLVQIKGTEDCVVLSTMMWFYVSYFGIKMIPALKHVYRKFAERKKKGIEYFWFSVNPEAKNLSFYENHSKEL